MGSFLSEKGPRGGGNCSWKWADAAATKPLMKTKAAERIVKVGVIREVGERNRHDMCVTAVGLCRRFGWTRKGVEADYIRA